MVSVANPAVLQRFGSLDSIEDMLRTDLVSRAMPQVMQYGNEGIPFSQLPLQAQKLSDTIKAMLADEWLRRYGLRLDTVAVQNFTLTQESKAMYEQMRTAAVQQPMQQPMQQAVSAAWSCPYCGAQNSGKFCTSCGAKKE